MRRIELGRIAGARAPRSPSRASSGTSGNWLVLTTTALRAHGDERSDGAPSGHSTCAARTRGFGSHGVHTDLSSPSIARPAAGGGSNGPTVGRHLRTHVGDRIRRSRAGPRGRRPKRGADLGGRASGGRRRGRNRRRRRGRDRGEDVAGIGRTAGAPTAAEQATITARANEDGRRGERADTSPAPSANERLAVHRG